MTSRDSDIGSGSPEISQQDEDQSRGDTSARLERLGSSEKAVHESSRKRSRTPDADTQPRKPKRKDAGFKWKEKRRDTEQPDHDSGLKRGYRDQYKPRERSRSRSPRRRDNDRYDDRRHRDRPRDNRDYEPRRAERDDEYEARDRSRRHDRDEERRPRRDDGDRKRDSKANVLKADKPKAASTVPTMPQQEMILVTVNDRLGTKKQVPCLPSDTVKDFKAVVAMMIGRRPHEILLKRQSERPFKDFLTLQDYGISNNVQLDLEVDTGD